MTEKEHELLVDDITNHPDFKKTLEAGGESLKDVKGEMEYENFFVGGPENVESSFSDARRNAIEDGVNWETAKFLYVKSDIVRKRPWILGGEIDIILVDGNKKYCLNLDDANYVEPIQSFKLFDNMRWYGDDLSRGQIR